MTTKIKKLVIEQNRWLRAGKGGGLVSDRDLDMLDPINYPKDKSAGSSLLSGTTSRMCCLGFASCAAGIAKKNILNKACPSSLDEASKKKLKQTFPWLLSHHGGDSGIASQLMSINDSPEISLPNKRAQIKKIFADNGVDVVFTR